MMRTYDFSKCTLCPRACGANRLTGRGICGAGAEIKIARAALHFWEEPCLSGTKGAGTVFFSGCPLHCIYCQNAEISGAGQGIEVSAERFREICFELKAAGAHNLDLVTPTHFAPQVREALEPVKQALGLPIVVNTGGYDSMEQLSFFDGLADIYLPDFKYGSAADAAAFSHASDYPQVAERALREMVRQVGKPVFDGEGLLRSGVIVRHLILPGRRKESLEALRRLRETFSPGEILLSVMSQYCPMPGAQPPLDRKITTFEAKSVCDYAASLGFDGWFQDRASAIKEYIPTFDGTGVREQ